MRRRVVKYQRYASPRFAVEEKRRTHWFEPERWRIVNTFDTLAQAVDHFHELENRAREFRNAECGLLEVICESEE